MTSWKGQLKKILKEFAIIFFGVILALAGENYIEYLNDRSSEKDYLKGLLEELEVTKSIYVSDRQRYNQTDSAAAILINISKTTDTTSYDLCRLLQIISQLIEPDIYKSVYEDLKSTGHLSLIRNTYLRHGIITYYQRELYEEKWANDIRDNLFKPYDKWPTDLLTVDEFGGLATCDSKRILRLLKQEQSVNNLSRARKMSIQNGKTLEERIERTDELIRFIRAVLRSEK